MLVVDDEPSVRAAPPARLALERYEVQLANDGQRRLTSSRRGSSTRSCSTSWCRASRPRGLPEAARRRRSRARAHADRARRDRRPRRGPRRRRRRLPRQAVRPARARRPLRALLRRVDPGPDARVRRSRARSLRPRGAPRRPRDRADPHGVLAARALPRHPRQVLTRSVLFERVWGYDFSATSTRSASTSATCGARPRPAGSAGCCARCAGSASSCATHDGAAPPAAILTATTVGITVVLMSIVAYVALRAELRGRSTARWITQYRKARMTSGNLERPDMRFPARPRAPASRPGRCRSWPRREH